MNHYGVNYPPIVFACEALETMGLCTHASVFKLNFQVRSVQFVMTCEGKSKQHKREWTWIAQDTSWTPKNRPPNWVRLGILDQANKGNQRVQLLAQRLPNDFFTCEYEGCGAVARYITEHVEDLSLSHEWRITLFCNEHGMRHARQWLLQRYSYFLSKRVAQNPMPNWVKAILYNLYPGQFSHDLLWEFYNLSQKK